MESFIGDKASFCRVTARTLQSLSDLIREELSLVPRRSAQSARSSLEEVAGKDDPPCEGVAETQTMTR